LESRHLIGNLSAQASGFRIAALRRQIEPLVRHDEVDGYVASARIHHAKIKEGIGRCRRTGKRSALRIGDFESSHSPLPCRTARQFAGICGCTPSPPAEHGEYQAKI